MPKSLQEFLVFARTDAAVQERVTMALKSADASSAVAQVALAAGWSLDVNEVKAELAGMLGEHELEGVVGGFRASGEWFSEVVAPKPVTKGPG